MTINIITSINDPFSGFIDNIKISLENEGVILRKFLVEQLVFENFKNETIKDPCYFLSIQKPEVIRTFAHLIAQMGIKIINGDYILSSLDNKINCLSVLKNNNIDILTNFFSFPITNVTAQKTYSKNLPLVLKSTTHMADNTILNNHSISLKELTRSSHELVYLEKHGGIDKVLKAYFVNDQIFYYKGSEKYKSPRFEKYIRKICGILSLELASIDFIPKDNKYYIIDVNHAPVFGGNMNAQIAFINYLKKLK